MIDWFLVALANVNEGQAKHFAVLSTFCQSSSYKENNQCALPTDMKNDILDHSSTISLLKPYI